jgi:hypothetical protein
MDRPPTDPPASPPGLAAFPHSRALLIGAGHYLDGSGLPDVPAVSTTLADLRLALLTRCGLPDTAVRVLADPDTAQTIGEAVAEAADKAEDLLLVYYVGHGLIGSDGTLHLAAAGSEGFRADRRVSRVEVTALPYSHLRNLVAACAARSRIVVLDCCFSGRARHGLAAAGDEVADLTQITGGFVLTSAGSEELALAPPGARHTAFSGALIRLLLDGDPQGPPALTLQQVHRTLATTLPAAGFPRPRQRSDGRIGDLVLAANPAYRAATGPTPTAVASPPPNVCPYLGLAAFGPGDEAFFHGRQALVTHLVRRLTDRLDDPRPLIVTGASGSGKSSLLRAGLVPAIGRGELGAPGSSRWPTLLLTPTADPVTTLAARLADLVPGNPQDRYTESVRVGGPPLVATLREIHAAGNGHAVWIIDQFEELFSLCGDESDRMAVVRALALLAAGIDDIPPHLVVIGVRSDFYGHCTAYPELTTALEGDQVVVHAMTAAQTRTAIEEPARLAALTVAPGLVELLLADLGTNAPGAEGGAYEPGRLPLLAHALRQTWQHRTGRELSVDAYRRAGGIQGGLAATADRIVDHLDPEGQIMARRILTRLVKISDSGEDTRRSVPVRQLTTTSGGADLATTVLSAFAADDARLVTADGATVTLTHEALITAWPRLRRWLNDDRADLLMAQRLVDAADEWLLQDRDPSLLYTGARLAVADQWAGREQRRDLPPAARDFLDAGIAQREEQQRRAAAAEAAAHRRARRDRISAVVLGVLLVASLAGGTIAVLQRQQAQHQEQRAISQQTTATARGLTLQAETLRPTQPGLSLRLAVAAFALAPDQTLTTALDGAYPAGSISAKQNLDDPYDESFPSAPQLTAFNPAGGQLAVRRSGFVELWNITEPEHPRRTTTIPTRAFSMDFSPDGELLATTGPHGIQLWELDGTRPRLRAGIAGTPLSVAFGPVGRTLTSLTETQDSEEEDEESVGLQGRRWDVSDPGRPRRLPGFTHEPLTVGPLLGLAATSIDGRFLSWGQRLWEITASGQARVVADLRMDDWEVTDISRDGRLAAAVQAPYTDGPNADALWNITDPAKPRRLAPLAIGDVHIMTFSPDARLLATDSGTGHDAVVWNIDDPAAPRRAGILTGHKETVDELTWSSDGRLLATFSLYDEVVRLWNIPTAAAAEADPVREACRIAGGGLTAEQWASHVPGLPYRQTCPL